MFNYFSNAPGSNESAQESANQRTNEDLKEKLLSVDYGAVERTVARRLAEYLESSNASCYVMGLSGGVDSSVVAVLAAKAVGPNRTLALIMPDSSSTPKEDVEDAVRLAQQLGIKYFMAPIDAMLTVASNSIPLFDARDLPSLGNLKARLRMVMLYYVANRLGGLVLGTSDRSELLLGYFTKFGDGAADLLPIGDLYKSQVRRLAKHLGLPERIAYKPSSPRLWPGQMAESELGFSYEIADLVLFAAIDLGLKPEEISGKLSISSSTVQRVIQRVKTTSHKRQPPPVVDLKGIAHP